MRIVMIITIVHFQGFINVSIFWLNLEKPTTPWLRHIRKWTIVMFQCFNFDLVILWHIDIWWYKRRNTGRQTRDKTVDPTRTEQQDVSGSAAQTMFSVPMFNVLSLQCSIYCHITKVCVYNVNFTSEHGPRLAKWWTLLSLDFKLKIENLWGALYSLTWIVSTWVVPEYGRLSEYPETLSTVWSLVWTLRASNLVTDCAIDSNSTNS